MSKPLTKPLLHKEMDQQVKKPSAMALSPFFISLVHNLWDLNYLLRQLFTDIEYDFLNIPVQLQIYKLHLPHV